MHELQKMKTCLELGNLLRLEAALGPRLVSFSPHTTSTDVLILSGAVGITFVFDSATATTQVNQLVPSNGTIYCPAILCPTTMTCNNKKRQIEQEKFDLDS